MKFLTFFPDSFPPNPFKSPLGPIWELLQRLKSSSLTAIKHGHKVKTPPASWALGSIRGLWQTAQLFCLKEIMEDEKGGAVDKSDWDLEMTTSGAY